MAERELVVFCVVGGVEVDEGKMADAVGLGLALQKSPARTSPTATRVLLFPYLARSSITSSDGHCKNIPACARIIHEIARKSPR